MRTIKFVALTAIIMAPIGAFLLGDSNGYERAQAEADQRAIERLHERGWINEEVANLGTCELVIELGGECVSDASGD